MTDVYEVIFFGLFGFVCLVSEVDDGGCKCGNMGEFLAIEWWVLELCFGRGLGNFFVVFWAVGRSIEWLGGMEAMSLGWSGCGFFYCEMNGHYCISL